MERYGALRKIMIMILLSILGSYCIGAADYKQQVKESAQQAMDYSFNMMKSVGNYCQKLWSALSIKVKSLCNSIEDQDVEIQNLSQAQQNFYDDTDKCLPGKGAKSCKFNEEFFDETYLGFGPENVDSALNIDYANDPIV